MSTDPTPAPSGVQEQKSWTVSHIVLGDRGGEWIEAECQVAGELARKFGVALLGGTTAGGIHKLFVADVDSEVSRLQRERDEAREACVGDCKTRLEHSLNAQLELRLKIDAQARDLEAARAKVQDLLVSQLIMGRDLARERERLAVAERRLGAATTAMQEAKKRAARWPKAERPYIEQATADIVIEPIVAALDTLAQDDHR